MQKSKFESQDTVINRNNGYKAVVFGRHIINDKIKYLIKYEHNDVTEWVDQRDLRIYRKRWRCEA